MRKLSGIQLPHEKKTAAQPIQTLPLPQKVLLPMSMHMGAVCTPTVKLRQTVAVGECIGTCEACFSADIHASVSGEVTAITDYRLPNGSTCKAVEITADGQQTPFAGITPPTYQNKDEFVQAVRKSGAVGLGGAGFPTHVKLGTTDKIDFLVINAAECEPYITSDDRTMQEHQQDIIDGIRRIMQVLEIPECIIGVENNKPEAIRLLHDCAVADPAITLVPLPSLYPQGAEKVLIYHTTGRIVEEGQLPSQQGVMVLNVSTVAFLEQYFRTGMPLVSRTLTVEGDTVAKPCNVHVPLGTSVEEVLTYAGCDLEKTEYLISGGPMMGSCLASTAQPVTKPMNALLAFAKTPKVKRTTACIRCGRCMGACPMNLMPTALEQAFKKRDKAELEAYHLSLCMLCGSCSYVCPANRPLAETNRLAKDFLRRH